MADEEFDLDLGLEEEVVETPQRKENKRLKDLSEKVKLTSEERDEKEKLLQEEAQKREQAEKDVEFYKGFNTLAAKFPAASEYQDQIREKVLAGYDAEDAAVAILNKEGKLPGMTQAPIIQDSPAGGSASTAISSGEKSVSEMTQEERRAELSRLSGEEMQQAFRSASSL